MRVLQSSVICIGAVVLALGACGRPSGTGKGKGEACTAASECETQVCTNGVCSDTSFPGGDGGTNPDGGGDPAPYTYQTTLPNGQPCQNLQCRQVVCTNGAPTRITGKVYDPAGANPLFNATVYVPNEAVAALTQGVTCERCGAPVSGSPVAITVTGSDGSFKLDNMPTGSSIPLVIQIGKWRRQVTLPAIEPCQTLALTDPNVTRLPRNHTEGDMPLMAIASGNADPFECLLRKIGIDDSEFIRPDATSGGRVHYYLAAGGRDLNGGTLGESSLWTNRSNLDKYDVVILPCEGAATPSPTHPTTAKQNIVDYTGAGGRLFATHYSYDWVGKAPFGGDGTSCPSGTTAGAAGCWTYNGGSNDPKQLFDIDTSFQKGEAFAKWLTNVGALSGVQLPVIESRYDLRSVSSAAQRWVYGKKVGTTTDVVQHMTFNTPTTAAAEQQCGRVVFSDFHVSGNALVDKNASTPFPAACVNGQPMSEQEKALEFMLFDLSSCVQSDTKVCGGSGQTCDPFNPCCNGLACRDSVGNDCQTQAGGCTCQTILQ